MSLTKLPPAKKQKKETPIKDLDKAKEVISKYLEDNLRPYSVNDVYLNLHGCIAKTLVAKALTALTDENKLVLKTFGKMSFYVFKIHESDLKSLENPDVTLEVVQGLEQEQNDQINRLASLQSGT